MESHWPSQQPESHHYTWYIVLSLCFCLNPTPPQQSINILRTDTVSALLLSCAQFWDTLLQSFYSQHYSGPLDNSPGYLLVEKRSLGKTIWCPKHQRTSKEKLIFSKYLQRARHLCYSLLFLSLVCLFFVVFFSLHMEKGAMYQAFSLGPPTSSQILT